MNNFLGIDTSNYTTSIAAYNAGNNSIVQAKQLLSVSKNSIGLRQSDAVFAHVKNLPDLFYKLKDNIKDIKAIGVSTRPRNTDGSYMPCFTVGTGCAKQLSVVLNIPIHKFSHQQGHIAAALYSANKLPFLQSQFIAFHVSGGTTESLLVNPDKEQIMSIDIIAASLDLKAGQAIDRIGVMLGFDFPAGAELDKLALKSNKEFKVTPALKNFDCCLSGLQNLCKNMYINNSSPEDIAKYCFTYLSKTFEIMCEKIILKYGDLPVVFAGGVMSNTIIRKHLSQKFNAFFASPEYSCDNAAGIAILSKLKEDRLNL